MDSPKILFILLAISGIIIIISYLIKPAKVVEKSSTEKSDQYVTESYKLISQKKYDQAIELLNKAIADNPNNYKAFACRGSIFLSMPGKTLDAKNDMERALIINPDGDYQTFANLSAIYSALDKNQKKAVEYATKSIELNSKTNEKAYVNRSAAYLFLKEYSKTIEDSNKAISINPSNLMSYLNRAQAYRLTGQYDAAIRDFKKLDKFEYDQSRIQAWLGACYKNKGDKKSALLHFRKSLSMKREEQNINQETQDEIKKVEETTKNLESDLKIK